MMSDSKRGRSGTPRSQSRHGQRLPTTRRGEDGNSAAEAKGECNRELAKTLEKANGRLHSLRYLPPSPHLPRTQVALRWPPSPPPPQPRLAQACYWARGLRANHTSPSSPGSLIVQQARHDKPLSRHSPSTAPKSARDPCSAAIPRPARCLG